MAEKRMFSKDITESDAFLELPLSTQALYFHLAMQADDDGFVGSPKKTLRMLGSSKNEYDLLVAKKFLLEFEDGIVVIKHWLMHNYIRVDRYKPTVYIAQKEMLFQKANKAYTLDETSGLPLGIPKVDTWYTKGTPLVDVDKSSIDKINIDKSSIDKSKKEINKRFIPPVVEEVRDYCNQRQNGIDPQQFIDFYSSKGWVVGKSKMKDWKASIRVWEKNRGYKPPTTIDIDAEPTKELEIKWRTNS